MGKAVGVGFLAKEGKRISESPKNREAVYPQATTEYGRVPEWPKGADCKSVASRFDGSNPSPPTKVYTLYHGKV